MTTLAWQRAGTWSSSPSRPAAVLLHEWAGSGADWGANGWAQELVGAGYDVLVCDLPGHADSAAVTIPPDTEPGPWTAGVILDDLARLHVKHCAVVAYASAAPLGTHLAVKAPAVVAGTVLIACDDAEPESLDAEVAWALRWGQPRVFDFEIADQVRRARADRRHDPIQLATWLESSAWPALPRLGELPTPVLLAVGTEDRHRERAPRLAARFADARLVTVPGDERSVLSSPALIEKVVGFLAGLTVSA
jgi:pimeloyl-ACP methyl ester carboxylesterase